MKKFYSFVVLLLSILFSSQVFAQTFSGEINYTGAHTGNVHIVWAAAAPGPSCDTVDWSDSNDVDIGPAPLFPFSYGPISVPSDGPYCVAAYIDAAPSGYPPDFTDPIGVHTSVLGSITHFNVVGDTSLINITVADTGPILSGAWNVTANVSIGAPVNANCVYSGIVGVWHAQAQNVMVGVGVVESNTPACAARTPVDITVFCSTATYPALTNCTMGGDLGPYTGLTGTVTSGGNSARGSFNGSALGADYTVVWSANRQQTVLSIPNLTEWGTIIFAVLAGLGAVCYMRRQRREKSS